LRREPDRPRAMRKMNEPRSGTESGGPRLAHEDEVTSASITGRMASASP